MSISSPIGIKEMNPTPKVSTATFNCAVPAQKTYVILLEIVFVPVYVVQKQGHLPVHYMLLVITTRRTFFY